MAKSSKKEKSEIQVFENFTDNDVVIIFNFSEKNFYQRDEIVFKEKSKDASLYIVLSGKLEAITHSPDGKGRISLSFIEEGEVFGELSFLDGKARSATIVAVTDVELLKISKQSFEKLQKKHPDIASKLIVDLAKVVSLRLRNADKFIVDIFEMIRKNESKTIEVIKDDEPVKKVSKRATKSKIENK